MSQDISKIETAKDILDTKIGEVIKLTEKDRAFQDLWMLVDPSPAQSIILNAMKEIADKAWEAGVEHGFDPERYYSTEEAKAAFMKSLFPLKEI